MQQLHNARRCAGPDGRLAGEHPPDIFRMKGVGVLIRPDGLQNGPAVDVPGQGELHKNAIGGGILIEPGDQRQQRLLGGLRGQLIFQAADAALLTVLFLVAYIDRRGGVVSHQDHRQTRLPGQCCGLLRHLQAHFFGQRLAIHDDRHVVFSFC